MLRASGLHILTLLFPTLPHKINRMSMLQIPGDARDILITNLSLLSLTDAAQRTVISILTDDAPPIWKTWMNNNSGLDRIGVKEGNAKQAIWSPEKAMSAAAMLRNVAEGAQQRSEILESCGWSNDTILDLKIYYSAEVDDEGNVWTPWRGYEVADLPESFDELLSDALHKAWLWQSNPSWIFSLSNSWGLIGSQVLRDYRHTFKAKEYETLRLFGDKTIRPRLNAVESLSNYLRARADEISGISESICATRENEKKYRALMAKKAEQEYTRRLRQKSYKEKQKQELLSRQQALKPHLEKRFEFYSRTLPEKVARKQVKWETLRSVLRSVQCGAPITETCLKAGISPAYFMVKKRSSDQGFWQDPPIAKYLSRGVETSARELIAGFNEAKTRNSRKQKQEEAARGKQKAVEVTSGRQDKKEPLHNIDSKLLDREISKYKVHYGKNGRPTGMSTLLRYYVKKNFAIFISQEGSSVLIKNPKYFP